MERRDKAAYKVLRANYGVLCTDVDARRITAKATERGLISKDDKKAVWQSVSTDGVSAGTETFLDVLLQSSQDQVFQKFVALLDQHGDMKFWADCLRDEYETERRKELQKQGASPVGEDGTKNRRSQLQRNLHPGQEDVVPHSYQELPEMTVLRQFSEAKGHPLEDIKGMLSWYSGDLRSIRNNKKKSLLHLACEDMDFRTVKYLVEECKFPLNEQDSGGNTPLHIACSAEKIQSAMYLSLQSSCNPNIKNSEGMTPLHIATKRRQIILIKHLLDLGKVDRTVKDPSGKTAVEIIRQDPELAPCLTRKTSTTSLSTATSANRPMEKSTDRKLSALPSVELYKSAGSLDTMALLHPSRELSLDSSETDFGGLSPSHLYAPLRTSATATEESSSRDEEAAASGEMGRNGNGHGPSKEDDTAVILRDKPKLRSLYAMEEGEESGASSCCLCCRHPDRSRQSYALVKKERSCCRKLHCCVHFCPMFKVILLLFASVFLGLGLLGALVYFLSQESASE